MLNLIKSMMLLAFRLIKVCMKFDKFDKKELEFHKFPNFKINLFQRDSLLRKSYVT